MKSPGFNNDRSLNDDKNFSKKAKSPATEIDIKLDSSAKLDSLSKSFDETSELSSPEVS
jgi:hypothetical protein